MAGRSIAEEGKGRQKIEGERDRETDGSRGDSDWGVNKRTGKDEGKMRRGEMRKKKTPPGRKEKSEWLEKENGGEDEPESRGRRRQPWEREICKGRRKR